MLIAAVEFHLHLILNCWIDFPIQIQIPEDLFLIHAKKILFYLFDLSLILGYQTY
jgi:hypothetical protein